MKKMKKIILSLYFVILINPAFSNVLIKMEDKIVINEQSWDQLGLSEEQKKQVLKIQKDFKESIEQINTRVNKKRSELNNLIEQEAEDGALEQTISEIASLNAEQLWLIIKNKKHINKVIGETKNNELMSLARKKFKERKEKFGGVWPPVPNTPPLPTQ